MHNQETRADSWSELSALLGSLYCIVYRLRVLFLERNFTPDEHLVRNIGEAVRGRMFDLGLLRPSSPEHDATTADGRNRVQIKLAQGKRSIAFKAEPEHLLVLRLENGLSVNMVYSGRGTAGALFGGR